MLLVGKDRGLRFQGDYSSWKEKEEIKKRREIERESFMFWINFV